MYKAAIVKLFLPLEWTELREAPRRVVIAWCFLTRKAGRTPEPGKLVRVVLLVPTHTGAARRMPVPCPARIRNAQQQCLSPAGVDSPARWGLV